jgi:hypothetical protein
MERRLRLSDENRRILLEALRVYFQAKVRRHYDEARAAYKLAFAIYMTRTGRRSDYGYSSKRSEMLHDLRKWEREVTYKPRPLTPEQQIQADAIIARLRGG